MPRELPIGVFDSGIGGLTVASAILKELPDERLIYFGDTARCPYGDRRPAEVLKFTTQILDYLYQQGVKMMVIACNTATAVALPSIASRYDVPVIGVVEPGARAAGGLPNCERVGVIGTTVTIDSGAYEHAIRAVMRDVEILSLACPTFVPLVERGVWSGPLAERTVREALEPLRFHKVDTVILGCTHYPLLQAVIAKVMGPEVRLISSAEETAREVKRVLNDKDELFPKPQNRPNIYLTSGDETQMRSALKSWMAGVESSATVKSVSKRALSAAPR